MRLIRLLLILVVLVVGGGFLGSLALNGALRKGVETAGSQELGVATTLESAALGLLSGKLDLTNLAIANPPGFGDEPFLSLEGGHAELAIMSLRGDVIELPVLELNGLSLRLVQRMDGSNYRSLLENIGGKDEPAGQPPAAPPVPSAGEAPPAPPSSPPSATPEKGWIIREVVFRNVSVTGVVEGELGGQALRRESTLNLPEVRLADVGKGGDALTLEQQIGRMLEGLLEAVLDDSVGGLPEGLGSDLGAVLATEFKKDDLEGLARDRLDQEVQKGLDKLFKK